MPSIATTLNALSGFLADYHVSRLHNINSDQFAIRLVTEVVTAATATNATLTEVTGDNYVAGGLDLTTNVDVDGGGAITLESDTDIAWLLSAGGWSGANSAMLYNKTSSRYVGFMDIRESGVATTSVDQDVDINIANAVGSAVADLIRFD